MTIYIYHFSPQIYWSGGELAHASIIATNTSDRAKLDGNELNPNTFWRLLLASSILIGVLGILALDDIDTNISGDGIPNRPQREPPIEYPWDQALQIIAVIALSAITAIYSWVKIIH